MYGKEKWKCRRQITGEENGKIELLRTTKRMKKRRKRKWSLFAQRQLSHVCICASCRLYVLCGMGDWLNSSPTTRLRKHTEHTVQAFYILQHINMPAAVSSVSSIFLCVYFLQSILCMLFEIRNGTTQNKE